MGWTRRCTAAVAAAACLLVPVAGAAPAAGQAEALRLSPLVVRDAEATTVATVPVPLVGTVLPSAAFSARQGARTLPVLAGRVVDGPGELVLAVDTGGEPAQVTFRKSAATDMLRRLPPDLRVVLLPGAVAGTVASTFPVLAALRPDDVDLFAPLPPPTTGRRVVAVLGRCAVLDRVPPALASASRVSVLADDDRCDDAAERLAAPTGGVARTDVGGPALFAGIDAVNRDLLGQYVVRVTDLDPALPLEVSVTSGTTTATGTTAAPAAGAAPAGRPPAAAAVEEDLPMLPVAAAAGLAGLAALGVLGLLLADRRSGAPLPGPRRAA